MTSTNNTGVHPIADQVLVRRDPSQKQTPGGLWVPDGSESWPTFGLVLEVGPRVKEPSIVAGCRVLFKSRPGSALTPDEREGGKDVWERVVMLKEENILALVEV